MKIARDMRDFAYKMCLSEEQALAKGMAEKAKEFKDSGAEVYS